jgi:transposase-like protein
MYFLDDESFAGLFGSEMKTIETLTNCGVLKKANKCVCGNDMARKISETKRVFRCNRNNCNHQVSYRVDSVFYNSRLECRKVMRIARCWLKRESRDEAVKSSLLNKETITTWYTTFNTLVHRAASKEVRLIGGPGIVVEIDEMKLGQRKYNRGHKVEGAWIVNGVERTSERRKFSVHVEHRDSETLHAVVRKHVKPGSIVYTDCWRGYNGIAAACNVDHQTVNHSVHFKDPISGVCTNTVEGVNFAYKSTVALRHRTDECAPLISALFIWRSEHKGRICDAFIDLIRIGQE